MALTHYKIKDKLVAQAKLEKTYAYEYKRARITEWQANERAINGQTDKTDKTIANQSFGTAHTQVQTMMSKIDEPVDFKYIRGELADTQKVEYTNAIKDKYRKKDRWDFKGRLGDYYSIVYGNAIFLAYGQQNDKKEFEFINKTIDVEDFFIDPSVEVEDIETANYLGWWGNTKTKKELEDLLKNPNYDNTAIKQILAGEKQINNTEQDTDKRNREYSLGIAQFDNPIKGVYEFYNWITTHTDGERYYLIFTESGQCIRCQKWNEVQHSGLYPIYDWKTYPEPTQFWSRSPLEVVRLNIEAQEKSLNDLLDNSDKINNPQKIVNVDNLRNPGQVKWKRNGIIEVTGNKGVNDVFQNVITPTIDTPIKTYEILSNITKEVSGVTNDVLGVSSTDTLGVYQGNVQQANDRFALLQQSRENGYYRLALLFREALKQHFTTKMAIKVLGTEGVLFQTVTAEEIKSVDNDFDIMIVASNVEDKTNLEKNKLKVGTIDKYVQLGIFNAEKAAEMEAKIVGFESDEIKELLNKNQSTNSKETQAVEKAFQDILKGKEPILFYDATDQYTEDLLKMMDNYQSFLKDKPELLNKLNAHQEKIQAIVTEKMIRDQEKAMHTQQSEFQDSNAGPIDPSQAGTLPPQAPPEGINQVQQ